MIYSQENIAKARVLKTLRAGYLELPSFQVSPEVSIGLTTDTTIDFTGDLQVDYCGTDKVLYNFYWAADDEED